MIIALILFTVLAADGANGVSVRDGCSEDASIVATVQGSDHMTVHHGVAGEASRCYAVSLTRSGNELRGYVLGSTLPAIQEFERRLAAESRVIPPPPPAAPASAEKKAADTVIADPGPLAGRQFEPWSGSDWNGRPVSIRAGEAKLTLVTFWKPPSRAARSHVQEIEYVASKFGAHGLKSVGFIEGSSIESTKYYTDDMSVHFTQALDRHGFAAAFGADSSKGTTLLLDASNKVIASSSDPKKIQGIVAKLLSLE